MFNKRAIAIVSWVGFSLLSVATVLGEDVRVCVRRSKRGVIIRT